VTIPADDAKFINQRIMEEYTHNWEVDGLPAAQYDNEAAFYTPGFDLGSVLNIDTASSLKKGFLNNHFDIVIHYHKKDETRYRIVGVLVAPRR